jgi:Xaa-Pro aminopeptidase
MTTMTAEQPSQPAKAAIPEVPFDHRLLDNLLEEAGIDVLVATSKHNVQYLLGGYRFFFFDYKEAIGMSRYLPVLIYPRGRPADAIYIANRLESFEKELNRFWTPTVETKCWGTVDAIELAARHIGRLGGGKVIGIEEGFIPADAFRALARDLGRSTFVDAQYPLERLRARKTPHELMLLREASERVVDSMLAVFATCRPGQTKLDVVEMLRQEETRRGLTFEYCLITAGASHNRAASPQVLRDGDVISLDSGANYDNYIGDLCRMGILGEPDGELTDILAAVDEVQMAARSVLKVGCRGGDVFVAAEQAIARSPYRDQIDFLAHGMGLVAHEAPQLTARGAVPYPGRDVERALEENMVISIETAIIHPSRGFIKLEDTVAVTAQGWEGYGDAGRGWNRAGAGK